MKNWKIIAWLVLFFPLGIYYMYAHSGWSNRLKHGLSALFGAIILISWLTGGIAVIGFLSSLSLLATSLAMLLKNVIQKTNKKHSVTLLVSSIFLIGTSIANIEEVEPNVHIASESEEQASQKEISPPEEDNAERDSDLSEATMAVEFAEKERTREALNDAYEVFARLSIDESELSDRLEDIEAFISLEEARDTFSVELKKAESNPTKTRLNRLDKLALEIDLTDESLITRLDTLSSNFEADEALKIAAEKAIETAEADPIRDNYEAASLAISSVQYSADNLINKLDSLEETVVANEEQIKREEEKAKKAEEERKIQEEAKRQAEAEELKAQEEAERKAKEDEKARAEANRQAQTKAESKPESSASSSSSSNNYNSAPATVAPTSTGEQALLAFINNASHAELQAVSFIGNKRATYIIEYRQNRGPFTSPSQVTNVNQIGDGIYSNLREMFNVQ